MYGHATLSIHFLFKYQITSQSELHDYFSGSSVEPEKIYIYDIARNQLEEQAHNGEIKNKSEAQAQTEIRTLITVV